MPKEEKEETSELEEEIIKEIEKDSIREISNDFTQETGAEAENENKLKEFMTSSTGNFSPSLEKIQEVPQQTNLEQDFVSNENTPKENLGNYINFNQDTTPSMIKEREVVENHRINVPALRLNNNKIMFSRGQRIAVETELDQMRNPQQEKGEYIANIKNIQEEKQLPFGDPKKRYKEKQFR